MARNRITGRETQKMQEYTQGQISQAERRGIEFPTDVKEQLFEYANLIGEEEKVRTLVRNLVQKFLNKWTIFLFCSILFSSNQKEH